MHVSVIRFESEATMTRGGWEIREANCRLVLIINEYTREEREAGALPF
jgi:hypothetical protein